MGRVDVAIPNYNYGIYLRACVESILAQGIEELRILIMDNASTDNSVEIARQLAREHSCVEVLARKTNIGLVGSLNEGNDWAQSDYLLSLSADDLLPAGALARAVTVMDRRDDVVAAFGRCLFFEDGAAPPDATSSDESSSWQIIAGRKFIDKLLTKHVVTLSPVVRTRIQKQAGYYRTETASPDFEMWLRWSCLGSIAESRASQAIQRLHQSNISNLLWRNPRHRFDQAATTLGVFFAHEGASLADWQRLQRTGLRTIGKNAYWTAVSHLLHGRHSTALELFRFAVTHCPSSAVLPPVDVLMGYSDVKDRIAKALCAPFTEWR